MPELQKAASLSGAASGIGEKTRDPSLFQPSASEVNLYQLHVEDLLSLNPHAEEDPTVTDLDNKLLLYYLFSSLPLCDVSSPPLLYRSFLLALYLFFFPPVFPSAFSVFSDAFRSFLPRIFLISSARIHKSRMP
jgi:hypothetical protein